MRIVIRVDASMQIGLGHAMRCLALAQALKAQGDEVRFVARHMLAVTAARITDLGFALTMLPPVASDESFTGYAAWLAVSWELDAQQTREVLATFGRVDWLVVDHYALDARWETLLRPTAKYIVAIDDLDNRPHDCDLLIDHNPSFAEAERYEHNTPRNCLCLLGPRYALLRPEFAAARGESLRLRKGLNRILITFGGTDPTGLTATVLAALVPLAFEGFILDVVAGSGMHGFQALQTAVSATPGATLYVDVTDMAPLYLSADLGVGAAGTSAWERCTLGLPSILLTLAENQRGGALALAELGGAIHLGDASANTVIALTGLVHALANSPHWLSLLSKRAHEVCDGLGASRVAARMSFFAIELRRARVEDACTLHTWHVRANDLSVPQIDATSSVEGWEERVRNPDVIVLVAEQGDRSCGMVCLTLTETGNNARRGHARPRWDDESSNTKTSADISIHLDPDHMGLGMAAVLFALTERWLQTHNPDIQQLRAVVNDADVASRRVFQQAGYAEALHQMLRSLERAN